MERIRSSEKIFTSPLQLGFLASHNGTDMRGIINAFNTGELQGNARVIISNNHDSPSLEYGQQENIPSYHLNEKLLGSSQELDRAMRDTLLAHGASLVILSGYMRKVGPLTRKAYPDLIFNVHPALLPLHAGVYGDAVHQEVLAAHEKETGVTIHTIDDEYDKGQIIWQSRVPVMDNDNVELLRQRVQAEEIRGLIELLKGI